MSEQTCLSSRARHGAGANSRAETWKRHEGHEGSFGGRILRDKQKASRWQALDRAQNFVTKHIPARTEADPKNGICQQTRTAWLTQVQDAGAFSDVDPTRDLRRRKMENKYYKASNGTGSGGQTLARRHGHRGFGNRLNVRAIKVVPRCLLKWRRLLAPTVTRRQLGFLA